MSESTQGYVVIEGLTLRTFLNMDLLRRIFPRRGDLELTRWMETLHRAEVRCVQDMMAFESRDWDELGLPAVVEVAFVAHTNRPIR